MEDTMLAAIFTGPKMPLSLEERPVPKIQKPTDVILQVGAVGICGSDLSILEGPHKHPALPGVILCHEFAGKVVEIGSEVKNFRIGQSVAVDPNPGCGYCYMCRSGYPNACIPLFDNPLAPEKGWPNCPGQWWDGGLARYVRLSEHHLYEISADVPIEHVALFEPIGVVVNGLNKIRLKVGEFGAVIGGGPIGLLSVALMKAAGIAKILACEINPERCKLLKSVGADIVVNPLETNFAEVVRDNTKGYGAHVVVEAVGFQLPLALDCICYGGRVAQIGWSHREMTITSHKIFVKEAEIYGSFMMKQTMNEAIRILESRLIPLDKIITHILPLEQVNEGIEIARKGNGGKVVIVPNKF